MTVEGIRRRTLLGVALGTAAAVGGAELWNAAPAHAEEVIKNPGFEEVTEGWPNSWEAFAERFDNLSVSQEQAHGGENSMLIDDDSATGDGWCQSVEATWGSPASSRVNDSVGVRKPSRRRGRLLISSAIVVR